jgi:hypothetical protein
VQRAVDQQGSEENLTLKRKQSFWVVAAVAVALTPVAANCQIAPERTPSRANQEFKYKAFVGAGYTSLNQVNQSNSGLLGVTLSVTRNFGKYFGVTAQGGHYQWTVTSSNPFDASVNMYLAGPEVHADLYEHLGIFVHGLLGAEHVGGVSIRPAESFAGGIGMGLDYKLGPRLGLRAYGDDIGSSFTLVPFQPGFSPHRTFSAHAAIGVTYNF